MKFVILTHGRSGSTLLMTALAQHCNVRMFGEIFHGDAVVRYNAFQAGYPGLFRIHDFLQRHPNGDPDIYYRELAARPDRYDLHQDGASFVRDEIFAYHTDEPSLAIGFKLFYDHARATPQSRSVWEALASDREVRILHLHRNDLLATHLSYHIAQVTGNWSLTTTSREVPSSVKIEPDVCRHYFEEIESYRAEADRLFAHHPVFHLTYETDLCQQFCKTMARIQEFLHLPYQEVKPVTKKVGLRAPADIIENYAELKRTFVGTKFERLIAG